MCEQGARLKVIGRRDRLPKLVLREIEKAEWATAEGRRLQLRVAIDYSSRDCHCARGCKCGNGAVRTRTLRSPELLGQELMHALTAESGDVDLLIRTGGEKRLSDFLLWESAYAELVFTERMWPDFDEADLDAALEEFRHRERRFGAVPVSAAPIASAIDDGTRFDVQACGTFRALNVKFILPALTEATDPYWRPIKYSLFPPLGLATLAAYLSPDDDAVIVDEHVEPLTLDDAPDLVVIQVYITNAYRAYRIADHYRSQGAFVCLGGLHVTSLPDEAAPHADAVFLGPGEQTFPKFLHDFRAGRPQRLYASTIGPHAGARPADPPRSDPAAITILCRIPSW